MNKMVALLILQVLSCVLADWEPSVTIFVTITLSFWFSIFGYFFWKIRRKNPPKIVNDKLYLCLIVICISAFLSPIACLFLNVLYPLLVMNKSFRFVSFHKSGMGKKFDANVYRGAMTQTSITNQVSIIEHQFNSLEPNNTIDSSHFINDGGDAYNDSGWQKDNISIISSDINPASGLPMVGNVDVTGNPYGIDRRD